jgi:DNA-binding NarL/FixJ family response regulator
MTQLTHYKAPKISRRETQILDLLSQGNSRKMIADELAIKDATLNSYFKNLYRKLNVNSATQALFVAKQHPNIAAIPV